MKSWGRRWDGLIIITQIVIEKPKGNNHLEGLGVHMRIIQV
jgi:hypothetical protein